MRIAFFIDKYVNNFLNIKFFSLFCPEIFYPEKISLYSYADYN